MLGSLPLTKWWVMNNRLSDLVSHYQSSQDKLSSQQDFSILDQMLVKALRPLEAETDAFREWLGEVLSFSLASRRHPHDSLLVACVLGLCGCSCNTSQLIVDAEVDRDLIFTFLNRSTIVGKNLETAQMAYIRRRVNRADVSSLKVIAQSKNRLGNGYLVAMAIRTSKYWYKLALSHKESIVRHYLRLLFKTASRLNHASGGMVELDQAFSEAYLASDVAINRFRPSAGVFASYLSNYLKGGSRIAASNALGLATPGARIHSADAIHTDPVDNLDIPNPLDTISQKDDSVILKINSICADDDIRAALMVSELLPTPSLDKLNISDDYLTRYQRRLRRKSVE